MILDQIVKANDIKNIDEADYETLAGEIRTFLIDKISKTGGHLGSNLGAVELTMALHLVLDFPNDKLIWDVGHQAYTHKILTGRQSGFDSLRKYGGMSGFPKRKESDCDAFDTGHSSTSISAGLGLVAARDIKGEERTVVSVIGDGALTGGMAYEALNNVSKLDSNFIIILNDNNMSISENVGGVSNYLNNIRTANNYLGLKEGIQERLEKIPRLGSSVVKTLKRAKSSIKQLVIPGMFFEDMDITYLGPVDGHNIQAMTRILEDAKRCKNGVLVHVVTQKGRGYEPAVKAPARFHGTEPFDIPTGKPLHVKEKSNYTDVFANVIYKLGQRNSEVVAITAAMPDGTGLNRFKKDFPDRFFDVGIAEEHAVTFAAGLAAGGLIPVVSIYSSFLQRAYDQIIHDVCIQNLPVIFAIDRAGIVGSDGETHQGIFDLSFLSSIPNMTIMAPKNKWELSDQFKYAVTLKAPVAIRYPRGEAYDGLQEYRAPITYAKGETIFEESEIALLAVGSMVKSGVELRETLKEMGYKCSLYNARFIKPIDAKLVKEACEKHQLIVTLEENVASGGYGEKVRQYMMSNHYTNELLTVSIPDAYVEHGNVDLLRKEIGMDHDTIIHEIERRMKSNEGTLR